MSRYLIVLCAAFVVTGLLGCENSKLQRDMMGDSTWETSAGDEDIHVAEPPPEADDKWEEEHAPMEGAEPSKEPSPQSSFEEGSFPRVTSGVIHRNDLVPVLDSGLGRYLQNVEMEPSFRRGTFVGFRIVSLFPGEPAYASLDLRPGDTVMRVNGKSIERPEQAAAVWDELRTASQLIVDYRRGGEEHTLRFTIVDES